LRGLEVLEGNKDSDSEKHERHQAAEIAAAAPTAARTLRF
jgi:hypothetical protein